MDTISKRQTSESSVTASPTLYHRGELGRLTRRYEEKETCLYQVTAGTPIDSLIRELMLLLATEPRRDTVRLMPIARAISRFLNQIANNADEATDNDSPPRPNTARPNSATK